MKPFFLKVGEMFVHGGQRREAEAAADFLEARRVSVLLDEVLQVVENFALAFGQREHVMALQSRNYTQKKGEGQCG